MRDTISVPMTMTHRIRIYSVQDLLNVARSGECRARSRERGGGGLTYSESSAGLSRCGRDLGFGAIRRGLVVDDLCDAEQQVAVGLGGDRIAKAFVRPVECADAALFVIAERGLAADAGAKIQGQAFPIAVLVHELGRRPILGR